MGIRHAAVAGGGPGGVPGSAVHRVAARAATALSGTLLVTGVSPRPDATGEQYVTITGVINGPTVNEHAVYQRMAVNVDNWPTVGELKPVVYSQRNPDNWAFTPPET